VVALNNPSDLEETFAIDLSAFKKSATEAVVLRTSPAENCKLLPVRGIENKQVTYSAPALSLTTFVIPLN